MCFSSFALLSTDERQSQQKAVVSPCFLNTIYLFCFPKRVWGWRWWWWWWQRKNSVCVYYFKKSQRILILSSKLLTLLNSANNKMNNRLGQCLSHFDWRWTLVLSEKTPYPNWVPNGHCPYIIDQNYFIFLFWIAHSTTISAPKGRQFELASLTSSLFFRGSPLQTAAAPLFTVWHAIKTLVSRGNRQLGLCSCCCCAGDTTTVM